MPWWSWSISAEDCNVGGRLREIEGSTCFSCYALKGRYLFPSVVNAHTRRREALDHPDFVEAFIIVLTRLAKNTRRSPYFRWMDSGDLPNLETFEKIIQIAWGTPQVQHWLPTRELGIVRQVDPRLIPSNLVIRLSAPMVGQSITPLPGTTWSGVDVPGIDQCPAPSQNNQCGDCRLCWGPDPVSYHLH